MVRGRLRAIRARLAPLLREHAVLLTIVLAYTVAGLVAARLLGMAHAVDLGLYSQRLTNITLMLGALFLMGHAGRVAFEVATRRRPDRGSLFLEIWRDLRLRQLGVARIGAFAIAYVSLSLFVNTFGSFKRLIPAIRPFAWDATFMELDRALHFGHHPWELLQPLAGYPAVTFLLNFFYNLWFLVMYAVVLWMAWSTRRELRRQFLVTYVLAWVVIGTLLATAFSSAGPAFYGRVTGLADPFAPLMQYLARAHETYPVWALGVQDLLWDAYTGKLTGSMVNGISAMPSMHVATSTLFAIVGWRTSRRLGMVLTAFAIVIQLGSVHLGWHYAIDGYASAALAVGLWTAVGAALRAYDAAAHRRVAAPTVTAQPVVQG